MKYPTDPDALLTVGNPKSSAQQVKTPPEVIGLVDTLLDNYIYPEIADILNKRGIRPGGSARRGTPTLGSTRRASLISPTNTRSVPAMTDFGREEC